MSKNDGTVMEASKTAIVNRSLRNIRTELEFLCDAAIISTTQLADFLAELPAQTALHAPLQAMNARPSVTGVVDRVEAATPAESSAPPLPTQPTSGFYAPVSTTNPPVGAPPAYGSHQQPALVATASALYEYRPSDAGDLALLAGDRVLITQYMNADWAKGRNERSGMQGIFPRSYVSIVGADDKHAGFPTTPFGHAQPPPPMVPMAGPSAGYGNMPLEVSQTGPSQPGGLQSKFGENGKKFGKKMGNAAIFGAGATIGSNIVNGIF